MYKALFRYLLFAISSCVACISKSVPRRLYQLVAALGFSFSSWEAWAGRCAETRGLLWARPWEVWSAPGHGQPGVHGGLCSSAPGFLDKMYERHKRRYSLCDISKVDRTVDVVLLKVWCLCTLIYGFLSPSLRGPCCACAPQLDGAGGEQVEELLPFSLEMALSAIKPFLARNYYPCNQLIPCGMQSDTLSESSLWPPPLSSAVIWSSPALQPSLLTGGVSA